MNQSQKNHFVEAIKKWWLPTSVGIIISLIGTIGTMTLFENKDSNKNLIESQEKQIKVQERQAKAQEETNKAITAILVLLQEHKDAIQYEKERNDNQDSNIASNTNKITDHEVRIKVLEAHQ